MRSRSGVGFLGAGGIAGAVARRFAAAGNDVLLSNSRGAGSLAARAAELGPGVRAADRTDVAAAEVVVLAVPWGHVEAAVAGLDLSGAVVVDATNPVVTPGFGLAELGGRTSSEVVQGLLPGAAVVKAFNTLTPEQLLSDPPVGRRAIFVCGDEPAARQRVAELAVGAGYAPVDLGTLAAGAGLLQFPGGPLPGLQLVVLE